MFGISGSGVAIVMANIISGTVTRFVTEIAQKQGRQPRQIRNGQRDHRPHRQNLRVAGQHDDDDALLLVRWTADRHAARECLPYCSLTMAMLRLAGSTGGKYAERRYYPSMGVQSAEGSGILP